MSSPSLPAPPALPDHDTIRHNSVIFLIGEGIIIAQICAAEAHHELFQAQEDEYSKDRVSEALQGRYHDALTTTEHWVDGYRLALQDVRADLLDIYGVQSNNTTPGRFEATQFVLRVFLPQLTREERFRAMKVRCCRRGWRAIVKDTMQRFHGRVMATLRLGRNSPPSRRRDSS